MSPDEYTALLIEAERLVALDPAPMSTDAGNLLALTQRIEDYESGLQVGSAWKREVIDALVVGHIYQADHEHDPRKALHDLISWECQIALDPAVSERARALANDKIRVDALEKAEHNGASPTLINDDNGHWAVACDGMQPIEVDGGKFQAEVIMQTFVEPQMWKGSIREAIDFWIESEAKAQAADNG